MKIEMLARNSSLFHPQTLLLSALSLQALGRGEEARAAMDEAVALLAAGGSDPQRPPVGSAWADWIICRQFRSEAEAALRPHETNPVAPSTSDARRR